jgi:hypothetical protein
VPVEEQQTPGGSGHSAAVQAIASPWYVPKTWLQTSRVRIWQVPLVKQQAPVGCAHGLGAQAVPLP